MYNGAQFDWRRTPLPEKDEHRKGSKQLFKISDKKHVILRNLTAKTVMHAFLLNEY